MIFGTFANSDVKLSEDSRTAQKSRDLDNQYIYVKDPLQAEKALFLHIIRGKAAICNSLEFIIKTSEPDENTMASISNPGEDSWHIKSEYCTHYSSDNYTIFETLDIDFEALQEDDIIGFQLNADGDLWYSFNGKPIEKITAGIKWPLWIEISMTGPRSVDVISILRDDNPIIRDHCIRYLEQMKKQLRNPIRNEFDRKYPLEFHPKCGSQIDVLPNWTTKGLVGFNTVARRKDPIVEFRNAVVISRRELFTDQIFKIRIEGHISKWNGSIEFGVTEHDPSNTELPITLTGMRSGTLIFSGNSILMNGQSTITPYTLRSLENLQIGDTIGVERKSDGYIYFYLNNVDLGPAGFIGLHKKLWAITDLYGRTTKISIVQTEEIMESEIMPATYPVAESGDQYELIHEANMKKQFPKYKIPSFNINKSNPVLFHTKSGRNVTILNSGVTARRINLSEFKNGVLFTSRPIEIGEGFFIKLTQVSKNWSGNLELGITNLTPDSLGTNFPPTMTYVSEGENVIFTTNGIMLNGHSLMSRSTEDIYYPHKHPIINYGLPYIHQDMIFGFKLISHNKVKFFINCADLGIVEFENTEPKPLYGLVDVYGKAEEVQILRSDYEVFRCMPYYPFTNGQLEQNRLALNQMNNRQTYERALYSEFDDRNTNNSNYDETSFQSKIVFHSKHGRNILLTNEHKAATCYPLADITGLNVTVISSRRLMYNELFEIKVENLDIMRDRSRSTMRMGLCATFPSTTTSESSLFNSDSDEFFYKHCRFLQLNYLWNYNSLVHRNYPLNLAQICIGTKLGIMLSSEGFVHYLLNGFDMGVAFDISHIVRPDFKWYAFVDFNGHLAQLSITDRTSQIYQLNNGLHRVYAESDSEDDLPPIMISSTQQEIDDSNNEVREIMLTNVQNNREERVEIQGAEGGGLTSLKSSSSQRSPIILAHLDRTSTSNDCKYFGGLDVEKQKKMTLFDNLTCGQGILTQTIKNTEVYIAHNLHASCMVRSNIPLESNSFHELIFTHNMSKGPASHIKKAETLIFGFVSYLHTIEELSMPKRMEDLNLPLPNILVVNENLYINNKLVKSNFLPDLIKQIDPVIRIGIYLFNNTYMEMYVNGEPVSEVIPKLPMNIYFIANLRGWFDSFVATKSMSVLDVEFYPIETIMTDLFRELEDVLNETDSPNEANQSIETTGTEQSANQFSETDITNLYSDLNLLLFTYVPAFTKYTKENESYDGSIIQKVSNELRDIDLPKIIVSKLEGSVIPMLISKHSGKIKLTKMIEKLLQPIVLKELAMVYAKEMIEYSDTTLNIFTISRQLELQVKLDTVRISYNRLIVPPDSLVQIAMDNENLVTRNIDIDEKENLIPGINEVDKYGLVYLNQMCDMHDLASIFRNERERSCGNGTSRNQDYIWNSYKMVIKRQLTLSKQPMKLGLVLIPTYQMLFPATCTNNASASFDYLYNISSNTYLRFYHGSKCPKNLSSLPNYISTSLQIQRFEMPSLVVVIDDGCVYVNEKKIIENIGFTCDKLSQNDDDQLYFNIQHERKDVTVSLVHVISKTKRYRYKLFDMTQLMKLMNVDFYLNEYDLYRVTPFIWLVNSEISVQIEPITQDDALLVPRTYQNTQAAVPLRRRLSSHRKTSLPLIPNCTNVFIANFVRESVCILPTSYFVSHNYHNHYFNIPKASCLVECVCYCSNCMIGIVNVNSAIGNYYSNARVLNDDSDGELILIGEPACQTRLPIGYVKYPISLKKDIRTQISKWHMAYLTVSFAYLHELLTVSDPLKKLMSLKKEDTSLLVLWLKGSSSSVDESSKSVVVSPWKPLVGCYLSANNTIETLKDAFVKFKFRSFLDVKKARIALEVRVKPNSYKFAEFKNQTMETEVEKKSKDKEDCELANKRSQVISTNEQHDKEDVFELIGEAMEHGQDGNAINSLPACAPLNGSSHSKISQKTVWILNKNSEMVITGLLVMPIK